MTFVPNPRHRLLLASSLLLFVELALIRWSGEHVVHLSFFSNVILLASFLGMGIGFLAAQHRAVLMAAAPWLLAGYVGLLYVVPVTIDRSGSDLLYFSTFGTTGPPLWVVIPAITVLSAAVMAGLGAHVAAVFGQFRPLTAYRIDIGGSVLGILAFGLLSWAGAPPVVWGVIAALGLLLLVGRTQSFVAVPLVVLVLTLGFDSLSAGTYWSPYYRVDTTSIATGEDTRVRVDVNGIPHQEIVSTDDRLRREPQYAIPYEHVTEAAPDVLVIGAGNGADVAVALAKGSASVDAVEIDPVLLELGRRLHPDRPYDDPRVTTHTTDGRAFLEQSEDSWDLILFALPDSLTLLQGQSALRLESYLFTVEAVEAARERLRPGGVLAMYNYYREGWLVERYANTMTQVFDRTVCVETVGEGQGLSVLVVGRDVDLCEPAGTAASDVEPVRDDRPFPYLRTRTLPGDHLLLIGMVLVLTLGAIRASGVRLGRMRPYGDLFLMGVAFLLLETRAVVQFALLFGTTWLVNAMVFGGVLVAVLAAIEVAERLPTARWRPSRPLMYGALVVTLAVAAVFPLHVLLGLPAPLRLATGVAVAFTPVFLANVLFADRFRDTASSTTAFGANLLGAVVGGLLEYASTLLGFRMLGIVAAVVYLAALAVERRVADSAQVGGTPLSSRPSA